MANNGRQCVHSLRSNGEIPLERGALAQVGKHDTPNTKRDPATEVPSQDRVSCRATFTQNCNCVQKWDCAESLSIGHQNSADYSNIGNVWVHSIFRFSLQDIH